jgi:hypothetical protein
MRFGMGYRENYERHCRFTIPKNYDVHHMDRNRNNDDPSNLVAIPRALHEKYHRLEYDVVCLEGTYGFDRNDIDTMKIDWRFNYYDYMSGSFLEWFEGTEKDFERLCSLENRKASFLERAKDKVIALRQCEDSIKYHKLDQMALSANR